MKTYLVKKENYSPDWYVVDASNKILGRFASQISKLLRGKHKEIYTPNVDTGDYVIILNANKIKITGNKYENKIYYNHTGYVGGIKKKSFKQVMSINPSKILKNAIKGMLPKGVLGRGMLKKLKVYNESQHRHIAQNPKKLMI
ncbi:50S ribosomal protein L13 [Buchnera aphidicola (Mindarus keteleerifoliae)]|uniref:50S ribosomal protein L13 n=1 Tax=Buchnera aphidicola TaxID=9 RepID=UPI0031B6DE7A